MLNFIAAVLLISFAQSSLALSCGYENQINPDITPRAEEAFWAREVVYYKGLHSNYESGVLIASLDGKPETLVYKNELGSAYALYSAVAFASREATPACLPFEEIQYMNYQIDFEISYTNNSNQSCEAVVRVWHFQDFSSEDNYYRFGEDAAVLSETCN